LWIAKMCAETTQTWQIIRLADFFEAANYIRRVAALVTTMRPILVATSCR
jgi:hypothetical protein